jgi:hypothetical protein
MRNLFERAFTFFDSKKNLTYLKNFGLLISILSLVFIFTELKVLEVNLNLINYQTYIKATLLMIVSYIMFGITWASFMHDNLELNIKNSFIYWSYSNLGKYIPGFIGIPILRFSQSNQIKSKTLFYGLLQEQLTPVVVLVPSAAIALYLNIKIEKFLIFFVSLVTILFLFKKIFAKFNPLGIHMSYVSNLYVLFAGFLFQYLAINLICSDISQESSHQLALLYTLSTSVSLIFIGPPSGIGIREFLLFQLSKTFFVEQVLITTMISLRVIYFFSDVINGILGLIASLQMSEK